MPHETGNRVRIRRSESTLDISCPTFGLHHATFLVAGSGIAAASVIMFEGGKALILAALGVGFAYYGLAGVANKARVRVDGRELSVRHGPLPLRRGVRLGTGSIRDVRREVRVTSYRSSGTEDEKRQGFDVWADDGRRDHLLVKDLDRARDADMIVSELRDFLGLPSDEG